MSEPTIQQRPAQPYLGIAGRITDGVPAFVDKAFPELYRRLGERGVDPSGPPFIRFRELDPDGEPLEIEVAAPVEGNAEGDERISAGTLPAGRYLTLLHRDRLQPRNHPRHDPPMLPRALPDRPAGGARLHQLGNRVRLPRPRRVAARTAADSA